MIFETIIPAIKISFFGICGSIKIVKMDLHLPTWTHNYQKRKYYSKTIFEILMLAIKFFFLGNCGSHYCLHNFSFFGNSMPKWFLKWLCKPLKIAFLGSHMTCLVIHFPILIPMWVPSLLISAIKISVFGNFIPA